ncbi:hypothetical protein CFC21_017045 [Triticum aestivum]|uniref:Uncharacterized protein n=2 Tax=Triticum aestivum TaxID=4565 RepID=A0A3B6AYX3_WHEAT|nr:hypothetical protein CFC21_017045 [Triticum aestivum]
MYAGVQEEEGGGLEGMPSKNLMVECRRRKRLNNREPSLQATSVVPRIIKSVDPGDAIDYMKELLERMWRLQEERRTRIRSQRVPGAEPDEIYMARNIPEMSNLGD